MRSRRYYTLLAAAHTVVKALRYLCLVVMVLDIIALAVGLVGTSFWWGFSDIFHYYGAWLGVWIVAGMGYVYLDWDR